MKQIIFLFLIAVFLIACGAPAEMSVSGVQAWVDQPIGGTVLPVGSFTLKAHARHASGSGVNKIEFLVNGVSVGAVETDPTAPLVYAETTWNASTPGIYQVSARAYAGAESSESSVVLVCVSQEAAQAGFATNGSCSVDLQAPPPNGDATTVTSEPQNPNEPPTGTPTITLTSSPPSVIISPTPTFTVVPPTLTFTPVPPTPIPPTVTSAPADTQGPDIKNLFHSAPGYYGGCAGTFTMQALGVTDPSGISSVIFGYRYEGGSTSGYYTASGSFIGNGSYELTIDNNSGNQAYNTLQGANGFIRWYVQAQDAAGNITTIGDQVGEILYCPG
ncbi:MAG: Ig-like domain-containing protein [Chloroflexi bacterium]|nr:Ig-like domain-containing protein [Chloroflexota bacterium]